MFTREHAWCALLGPWLPALWRGDAFTYDGAVTCLSVSIFMMLVIFAWLKIEQALNG